MQNKAFIVAVLIAVGLMPSRPSLAADAPAVAIAVDSGRVVGQIDERVYGQFLEHIYHSCNGGLWGDIVWNRSFEETRSRDPWQVAAGCLQSPEKIGQQSRFTVGDGAWRDYEFSVEARRISDAGALLIGFRVDRGRYTIALGARDGSVHELTRTASDRKTRKEADATLASAAGRIETGRWYRVRIRCEASHVEAWLDDQSILQATDRGGPSNGPVSVGVAKAASAVRGEFRNLKIAALDGRTLLDGPPPSPARHWRVVGPGTITLDPDRPLNSLLSIKIVGDAGETGVEQHDYCIRQGEVYRGSLWARGEASGGLVVRLVDGAKVLWEKELPGPQGDWKEFPLEIASPATAESATLRIVARGKATVWLDQVSLMPDSWRATGGFRPDLLRAVKELRPPIIRWPGGSFVGGYFWKNGIGPQHKRVGKKGWDELDPLSFGVDEFLTLCRKVGSEPLIAVNVGLDRPELVQDACDLIEYCNGPADSRWGRVRADGGHPEPYGVKYWEIGNETWGMGPERYAAVVRQFVPPMRKADPSIRIAACGSGGMSPQGIGLDWNRIVIAQAADLMDYLSIHHYEGPDRFATGPGQYEEFFRATGQCIAASKNPKVKLFVSEWNAQSTDWRTGLYCGGILNGFERSSDLVVMATPALFLRHVSAPAWDNSFINFDNRRWFPAPNYVVMKLYRDHYARDRVPTTGDPGPLNVMATRSADGRRIVFKAVNPSETSVTVKLTIGGDFRPGRWTLELVAPDDLTARNTLDRPHAVHVVEGRIDGAGGSVRFTLPRWSVGVAEASR